MPHFWIFIVCFIIQTVHPAWIVLPQAHFKIEHYESSPILLPNNLAQQLYRYTFAIFESDEKYNFP